MTSPRSSKARMAVKFSLRASPDGDWSLIDQNGDEICGGERELFPVFRWILLHALAANALVPQGVLLGWLDQNGPNIFTLEDAEPLEDEDGPGLGKLEGLEPVAHAPECRCNRCIGAPAGMPRDSGD